MSRHSLLLLFPTEMEKEAVCSLITGSKFDLRVVVTGVGPVAAAVAAMAELSKADASLVVLAGIAGAYRGNEGGIGPGEVCMAASEVHADLGRCDGGIISSIPLGRERVEMRFDFGDDLERAVSLMDKPLPLRPVPMATVSCCSASLQRASMVAEVSGAWVENMEGAGVAAAAKCRHTPLLEIRGISNWAGDVKRENWTVGPVLEKMGSILGKLLHP